MSRIDKVRFRIIDFHVHLGKSRDGASFHFPELRRILDPSPARAVVFAIDEPDAGPSYEKTNGYVLKVASRDPRLIPFARLNPRAGAKSWAEFRRSLRAGIRGIKLHPRSENFSSRDAQGLIREISKEKLPILLHASHEKNCRPLEWEKTFRENSKIQFILAHGGKDAFEEAVAVARRNRNVWIETSTLSFWRTQVILKALGPSRVVFGSDLPYSHPALEALKFELILSPSACRQVFFENSRKILGE